MHNSVEPWLKEDDVSDHFVQVDVVIEGEDGADAELSHHRDRVPQHEDENQHGVV